MKKTKRELYRDLVDRTKRIALHIYRLVLSGGEEFTLPSEAEQRLEEAQRLYDEAKRRREEYQRLLKAIQAAQRRTRKLPAVGARWPYNRLLTILTLFVVSGLFSTGPLHLRIFHYLFAFCSAVVALVLVSYRMWITPPLSRFSRNLLRLLEKLEQLLSDLLKHGPDRKDEG